MPDMAFNRGAKAVPDDARADFPVFGTRVHGHPLVYLDNAATSQKPRAVIDAVSRFYAEENANIHRGVHYLSVQATDAYDRARERAAAALGAAGPGEVVFVRGATEAINLVARSFLRPRLQEGDEILITMMEHHANIVPWQLVAEEAGARLVAAPVTPAGEVDLDAFERLLGPRTKLASFVHVSNVLGTVNPVQQMTAMAKSRGVPVLIDGAQAVPHGPVDVGAIGCDFYTFSGHKVYGPDGIGVLWGRRDLLAGMPPYQGGGDMIAEVRIGGTTFREPPERFEAGTPNISGAIGLAAAFNYLDSLGWDPIRTHEEHLRASTEAQLSEIPGLTLVGTAHGKASVVSFTMAGVHPHDIGTVLDASGVAIRAGNHCAQPLMEALGLGSTARASFAFYNTDDDVAALVAGVRRVAEMFA